ncbi:hypothetical protein BHU61_01065 [Macrococcus epidermidis]|uniref:Uncharacterized protein n=1 Tax=Macrococcus epidermidis TaxID=1902580 RepID=A0A327ZVH6_9STAP|nr:hypothetical protein [Macrococcus epidermidis]RAK46066.1 hypothetical protein BHU61_01065 [Macrococcus epidermidis]
MKKETIKSVINVAALILVPLYNERHRIKDHEEVQKATALSLKVMDTTKEVGVKTKDKVVHTSHNVAKAAHTVKSATAGTAQFVSQKAQDSKKKHQYNQQMNLYKTNEKLAQKNEKKLQKEMNKLDKNLSKHIEDRRNEEDKNINARQKELKKEMKQYKNYEAKLPEENINFSPVQVKKVNHKDQKAINHLAKKLEATMNTRHAEEDKIIKAQQSAMIKEMKKYKNHKFNTPKQKRSLFNFNQNVSNSREETNASNKIQSLSQPFVKNTNVSATPQQEKTQKTAVKAEENYDNAQLFEKHRQLMAQQIDNR